MRKISYNTLLFLFILATGVSAQQVLTLPEAIELAHRQSVDAAVALNELKTSYWEFRTYRAIYLNTRERVNGAEQAQINQQTRFKIKLS